MSLSLSLLILSDKIIIVGFVLLNLYLFLFSVFFVQLPFFNIRYCLSFPTSVSELRCFFLVHFISICGGSFGGERV
jgi:hypothetical protein